MPLKDSITALLSAAPEGTMVPLSWLRELLVADSGADEASGAPNATTALVDSTVREVADRFGKAPSTIRTWCERGELVGAYRLHGREWRIPHAGIEAMQRAAAQQHKTAASITTAKPSRPADIGAWRNHLPRSA